MLQVAADFYIQDKPTLLSQLLHWTNNFKFAVYLNSNNYPDIYGGDYDALIAVANTTLSFKNDTNRFTQLKNYCSTKEWLFGYLSYDLKNDTEKLVSKKPDGLNLPEICFFRPEYVIEVKDGKIRIHSSANADKIFNEISGINASYENLNLKSKVQYRTPRSKYLQNVEDIKSQIVNGDFYELNYCQQLYCENVRANPISLYHGLSRLSPSPFSAFVKADDNYVISTSPERFLAKKGNKLVSQPIKGTRKRDLVNKAEDERLIRELLESEKERAENLMIVDLVRNDLSHSSVKGSVKAEEICGVHSFPQVHQMISTVSSTLNPEVHPVDAIKYAFPMGSMTGAPKVEVMKAIELYEDVKRGVYSGAIGYFSPSGDFDFNVVIRSIVYNSSTHLASYHAGSAITYDAVAEQEYDECLLKALAFRRIMEGI